MVPLSERRHRLHTPEIPEVKRGLKLRLRELCEAWEDEESAEIVYRIFIRLNTGKPGRQVPGVQLGYGVVLPRLA